MAFNLLMNKVPISRMMEILDVEARTIYRKIDFIFEQCRLFAASREALLRTMQFERLYLSTDRQDYMVNWGDRSARKTVQLTAVGTADLKSGYLFGLTPNFDGSLLPDDVEETFAKAGDLGRPYALRATARLWTESDYRESLQRFRARKTTARDQRITKLVEGSPHEEGLVCDSQEALVAGRVALRDDLDRRNPHQGFKAFVADEFDVPYALDAHGRPTS